jgi:hypothetical protein
VDVAGTAVMRVPVITRALESDVEILDVDNILHVFRAHDKLFEYRRYRVPEELVGIEVFDRYEQLGVLEACDVVAGARVNRLTQKVSFVRGGRRETLIARYTRFSVKG